MTVVNPVVIPVATAARSRTCNRLPSPVRSPKPKVLHGITLADNYAWLRDKVVA